MVITAGSIEGIEETANATELVNDSQTSSAKLGVLLELIPKSMLTMKYKIQTLTAVKINK